MPIALRLPAAARALLILSLACLAAACTTAAPPAPSPLALQAPGPRYAAIVIDAADGRVLYQASAEVARFPASLTKMMTLYMLFEAIDEGRVDRASAIPVSAYAASRPPTRIGLRPGGTISVEEAVLSLSVKSANDVATAVAEYLAGSEAAFAAAMTARARQLGMRDTVFRNASGLPDASQRSTARDMALLSLALRKRFPHHYDVFSRRDFAYRGKMVRGHNRLIGRVAGVDGIKTGYIRASGYNVATSVRRGGRSLVVVVFGGETARKRDAHVEALIERYLPQASGGGGLALLN